MGVIVVCEYTDGRRQVMDEPFTELGHSVEFALNLADQLGSEPAHGQDMPILVRVIEGDRIELTVRVFRGGLIPALTH